MRLNLVEELGRIRKEELRENITVTFSGFNILEYLKVAIGSFLYFYPDMKKCIVVFDDESTDGTKEWLEENNIRRITWTEKYKQKRDEHYSMRDKSLIYRVGLIMNDIMEQTTTKYLMLNDGDVVFTRPFLNKYEALMKCGYKALICKGKHGDEMFKKPEYEIYAERFPGYKLLYNKEQTSLWRAHQYHGLFDLEYLREKGILHDRVFDKRVEEIQSLDPPIEDTGLDFLYQLTIHGVPYFDLQYLPWLTDVPVYHLAFKASIKRNLVNGIKVEADNPYRLKKAMKLAPHIARMIELMGGDISTFIK